MAKLNTRGPFTLEKLWHDAKQGLNTDIYHSVVCGVRNWRPLRCPSPREGIIKYMVLDTIQPLEADNQTGTHECRLKLKNGGKLINKQPDLASVAE